MLIPEFFKSNSPRKRYREGLFSLVSSHLSLATVVIAILLILGCSGEESVDIPIVESVGEAKLINDAPTSTPYYPVTLGSRWVYRNPDGSEWTRDVDESEVFYGERYHSFSYSEVKKARHRAMEENIPRWLRPIEHDYHDLFDSIGPAEYITYADQLVRPIKVTDFNDAIRQTILDSGGETPEWGFGLHCGIDPNVPLVCQVDKASHVFNPPGILSMLFKTNPHVASLGELTPLRFPLMANQSCTALELRLRSKSVILARQWVFYAATKIVAAIGNAPEMVETPAGTFQDCLKIRYEAAPISINTLQFVDVGSLGGLGEPTPEELKAFELALHAELTDLLAYLMPKLGLHTVWLTPGVGPVKIETTNGIAELIDYEMTTVATSQ